MPPPDKKDEWIETVLGVEAWLASPAGKGVGGASNDQKTTPSGVGTANGVATSKLQSVKPTGSQPQPALPSGMDDSKRTDKKFAGKQAQEDAARIKKAGTLSPADRQVTNERLSFFQGEAWKAYSQGIKPALAEVTREELQMPSAWAFALDKGKQKDKKYAGSEAKKDASRIGKKGTLSAEDREEVNAKLRFFQGEARDTYEKEIKPAMVQVTELDERRRKEAEADKQKKAEAEQRQQAEKRNYDGMAAYYASTRQAQLDSRDRERAKLAKEAYNMPPDQINSQWEDSKEAFISAASSPDHGLNKKQLLVIWRRHWGDKVNKADKMWEKIERGETEFKRGGPESERYLKERDYSR